MDGSPYTFSGPLLPLKIAPSCGGSEQRFLGPTRVHTPYGSSISSAVFAGLTSVTDRPTDRPRYSVCISRPTWQSSHVKLFQPCQKMRPSNRLQPRNVAIIIPFDSCFPREGGLSGRRFSIFLPLLWTGTSVRTCFALPSSSRMSQSIEGRS